MSSGPSCPAKEPSYTLGLDILFKQDEQDTPCWPAILSAILSAACPCSSKHDASKDQETKQTSKHPHAHAEGFLDPGN